MRRRAIGATLSCALFLAVLVGCGERGEPLGALPPDLPATVQGVGEEPFVSESVPTRIVALDDGVAATAYELGANVVGTPTDIVDPSIELIATSTGAIDIEAVRALEPDLILATVHTDPAVRDALSSDADAPIYTAADSTADDLVRVAYELAIILGDPVLAREVAATLQTDLDAAGARARGTEAVRVFIDTGFRIPPDPDSLFIDLLERAGGTFVPEDAARGSSVEPADLVVAAPDVYLATIESRVSLASLQSDELLASLPAVRAERIVIIDREMLSVSGPDIIATVEELAGILHPDVG